MSPEQARPRIAELRAEVARHDELYYRRARPEIADFDYDRLKAELAALEARFPAAAAAAGAETPTARVGDDRAEGFSRVKHRLAMTTLDNTYDEAELREFDARLQKALGIADLAYTVEPKIDGVAVSLTYERGRLTRAVTRGDGEEGDDVTANVKTIRGLPHTLAGEGAPDVIEIRGEIYLREEEFRRINQVQEEAGEAPYASTRCRRRRARRRTPIRGTSRRARSSCLIRASSPRAALRSCSTGSATSRLPSAGRRPSTTRCCGRGVCRSSRPSGPCAESTPSGRRSVNSTLAAVGSLTGLTVPW
ncbi:MAG: hypothetical protein RLZZ221_2832 [Verrucomicrobiota bacterium]